MSNHSGPSGPLRREQTSSSSPRKRRSIFAPAQDSSSASAISLTAKNKIILIYNEGCWHCGARPTDICHVISQKDKAFNTLLARGLIPFQSLSDPDNAILLCPLCYRNFDDLNFPGFIFIPIDLAFFIKFEQNDFQRRSEAAQATGKMPGRICPTAQDYFDYQLEAGVIKGDSCGGLYRRYTLYDYFPKLGQPAFEPGPGPFATPKPWHGAPMAALRRAFQVLGNLLLEGIPDDVITDLSTLIQQYRRNAPAASLETSSTIAADDTRNYGYGTVGGADAAGRRPKAITTSNVDLGPSISGAPALAGPPTAYSIYDPALVSSSHGSGPQREGHRRYGSHSDTVQLEDGTSIQLPWKWGPYTTSEMMARFYQRAGKPGKVLDYSEMWERREGILKKSISGCGDE